MSEMNQPPRQLSVLRSLFRTLHPALGEQRGAGSGRASAPSSQAADSCGLRSITDEHLLAELQNLSNRPTGTKPPRRNRKHYSRSALLALLEEASVRIQILETELEIARGDSVEVPLLTDEWEEPSAALASKEPSAALAHKEPSAEASKEPSAALASKESAPDSSEPQPIAAPPATSADGLLERAAAKAAQKASHSTESL